MKINYDKIADAIYFRIKEGEVSKTIQVNSHLNIDIDQGGETLGIELLDASSQQGVELERNIKNGVPIEIISTIPVSA